MSTIYDIDYSQQVVELLPPSKRYINLVTFLQDCAKQLQYVRDATLTDYKTGSTVADYVSGTYQRGDKVKYKKGIYVSLVDGNTDLPTASTWYFQQQFFIGLDERLAYNGTNLVLTYALNKWFGTTFRQPGSGTSDIYISTNRIDADTFRVGYIEAECSYVGYGNSSEPVTYSDVFGIQYNATIFVPLAVYNALQPAADALIRSFTDMYIYVGLVYNIMTY